jgi:hypothetical protein
LLQYFSQAGHITLCNEQQLTCRAPVGSGTSSCPVKKRQQVLQCICLGGSMLIVERCFHDSLDRCDGRASIFTVTLTGQMASCHVEKLKY